MDERKKILELVKSGQLTVDEADAILGALEGGSAGERGEQREVRRKVKVVRPIGFNFGLPLDVDEILTDAFERAGISGKRIEVHVKDA